MSKATRMIALLCVVGLAGSLGFGQAADLQRSAQSKLLAYRAARADAIRKLAERIQGLAITSETSVRDFVTESDQIQTSLTAWLSGAEEVGKPRHMEDGTCEVTMQVTLEEVKVNLERFHKEYYKGDRVKMKDLEKLTITTEEKVLKETGMGAPRVYEAMEEPGIAVPLANTAVDSLDNLRNPAKAFWLAHVQPQGRLMAVRAARVDGMRRLAERIAGVYITSETTVRDFVAESDETNVSMQAFLRGAREKSIRYHDDELIVEVDMEVTMTTVYAQLKSWGEAHFKGDQVKMKKLEELTVTTKDEILKETGMGVPPTKYLKGADEAMVAVVNLGAQTPGWATQTMKATGYGAISDAHADNPAQAKLMAYRAAELDARRKLAEQINGLVITSNTSVQDFVTADDRIETSMLAFQQGAHVLDNSRRIAEDGTAEVTVEIDLKPLWDMVVYYRREGVFAR